MSFFRAAFLLLVFANLAFFAWTQGYFGGRDQGREPQRLANQLAADNLRVVAPAAPGNKAADTGTTTTVCRLVTGLPIAEAEGFKIALSGLNVEVKPVGESSSYWVHIPPQANRAAAEKKASELKTLGIRDFYVVQDEGPSRFALSLGLFKSEAAASEYLQSLNKRGVRSARVEVRATEPQQARATIKGAGDVIDQRLPALLAKLPGTAVAECP